MTERLSDERLQQCVSSGLAGEVAAMAAEIIALRSRVVELDAATSNAVVEALSLRAELEEHKEIFDLRWNADMRAIALWREANPEKRFILPDHADLCVWLLDQLVAGPVMPEVPGDEVVQAAFASADIPQEDIDAEARADFCVFWGDVRAALQCSRKRGHGKDGLYCKQHAKRHPAEEAK